MHSVVLTQTPSVTAVGMRKFSLYLDSVRALEPKVLHLMSCSSDCWRVPDSHDDRTIPWLLDKDDGSVVGVRCVDSEYV